MEKEFKTIDEQIQILKSRKIIIEDYSNTYELLTKNNYYYLINGYKELFLDKKSKTEKYIDYVIIEEIKALYIFDKSIKLHFS